MTGIQALERMAPGLPLVPGKVERCEFEYKRHGTQTLIWFSILARKLLRRGNFASKKRLAYEA